MFEIARGPGYRRFTLAGIAALTWAAVAGAQTADQPADQAADQPAGSPATNESIPAPPAAQPETQNSSTSPFGFKAIEYSLRGYSNYELGADLNKSQGEVSILRLGAEFTAMMPVNERTRLRLSAGSEYVNYDWDNPKLGPGVVPFEELSNHHLGLGIENAIDDKWSWVARGMIRDGIEGGTNVFDGISGDISGGMMYTFRPGVRIGLGATVFFRLEDYTQVLPVPLVDMDVALNDHWSIVMSVPRSAGFVYRPSRDFTLNMGVEFDWQDYRLSANNPTPNGVFREFSLPLMVQGDWRFAPAWTLQAGVGVQLYQRFDINDENGFDVAHADTDWAPLFMLGVNWNF